MGAMASQITSLAMYSTVYSGQGQRKHQSSASLTFVWGIHRWPVNSPHKWPLTRKMFPFDDVIMVEFSALNLRLSICNQNIAIFIWLALAKYLLMHKKSKPWNVIDKMFCDSRSQLNIWWIVPFDSKYMQLLNPCQQNIINAIANISVIRIAVME